MKRLPVRSALVLAIVSAGLLTASVFLGIAAAAVDAPCARPWAECMGTGHAGRETGAILLMGLTVVTGLAGLLFLAVTIIGLLPASTRANTQGRLDAAQATREAKAARLCTKHDLVQYGADGPERLVWVYRKHRTAGNACDGPEHKRRMASLAETLGHHRRW